MSYTIILEHIYAYVRVGSSFNTLECHVVVLWSEMSVILLQTKAVCSNYWRLIIVARKSLIK